MLDNVITDAAGISAFERHFDLFLQKGSAMARAAGADTAADQAAFAWLPSCLTNQVRAWPGEAWVLLVDVGGTYTKVAVGKLSGNREPDYYFLFECDNEELNPHDSRPPLDGYVDSLLKRAAAQMPVLGLDPLKVVGLGVIWSNGARCKRFRTETVSGVTALVDGIAAGCAYRKGEFFVAGLRDGQDLGLSFKRVTQQWLPGIRTLLMGNDTIFTALAEVGAHCGMVAATGANATLLSSTGELINGEIGGHFTIPSAWLSAGDLLVQKRVLQGAAFKLEDLIAGRLAAYIFEAHLEVAAKCGLRGIEGFVTESEKQRIRGTTLLNGPDIDSLLRGEPPPPLRRHVNSAAALSAITDIAAALVKRAAWAAAGMAYFGIVSLLGKERQITVALDSSQARFRPGFWEAMQDKLQELTKDRSHVVIRLKTPVAPLNSPEPLLSVPLQGLARGLANELADDHQIRDNRQVCLSEN